MISATVDTSRLDAVLPRYLQETSKTVVEALNYKLFDGTREAIKKTGKASKNDIRSKLDALSNKYPARTVAEMIVIVTSQRTGQEIQNLIDEAETLKKTRFSSIGFTKSGWLNALRELLPHVGRESVSIGGVGEKVNRFGGAEIAKQIGSQIVGSSYNDVQGTGNKALVEANKLNAAQAGADKIASDIETYLSKKFSIPIERFNHS